MDKMKKNRIGHNCKKLIVHNWRLYVLMLPALAWLIIFAYYPMYGLLISFKDYKGTLGILGSPWATPLWKHFAAFFSTSIAKNVIVNTLVLSLLTMLFSFPIPILFALLLNQIQGKRKRKFVQTISYAPYFVSNVVVVSILNVICAPSGFVNTIIQSLIGRPLLLMGFSAIIYIAALTGISPEYHEAAIMDGATKLQRILHVDIPLIMPTIIIMLILALGNIMTVGYEKVYLMQAGTNTQVSEIISTYVYKVGLQNAQYSFATAVGLFNAVVNFVILVVANQITKKVSDISIF